MLSKRETRCQGISGSAAPRLGLRKSTRFFSRRGFSLCARILTGVALDVMHPGRVFHYIPESGKCVLNGRRGQRLTALRLCIISQRIYKALYVFAVDRGDFLGHKKIEAITDRVFKKLNALGVCCPS